MEAHATTFIRIPEFIGSNLKQYYKVSTAVHG
jgi:hypothetical protein